MKSEVFKTILLVALPASGKSEVRNLLAHMPAERLKKEFHIGKSLQLDDFPYVHMMRRIDNELEALGQERIFYPGEAPFTDGRDWGTLCALLNEDYLDLMTRNIVSTDSAAELLFQRIDRAAQIAGLPPRLELLPVRIRAQVACRLENEARNMLDAKHAAYPDSFEDKTVIIECARGGPDGATMPLTGTFGYQYSLPMFSPSILESSAVLYIWVTPEESRRKNNDRADPNDPGSNLHHGVPMAVMLGDYGTDDMQYLADTSEIPGTLTVHAHGKTYHLPLGIFDNRTDRTSFLREDADKWDSVMVGQVIDSIRTATEKMYARYPLTKDE
ncbi:MAG: hypothetical protein J5889_03855 [Clostridia bacterium]|nr:hypothetical protein [Clostridia bacterium]